LEANLFLKVNVRIWHKADTQFFKKMAAETEPESYNTLLINKLYWN